MLFPNDGGCVLYNPKEGKMERSLGDFSGYRFLANSGNWCLVLDSEYDLSIINVFSKETIPLPSLEKNNSTTSIIRRVGSTNRFERVGSHGYFDELSSDVVRGLLWVDEKGEDHVVVWLFDLPGHAFISFCKKGDTHYTDIPLFHPTLRRSHYLDGLSEMVLKEKRLYITSDARFVRVLDLSGEQGTFQEGKPFPMLSRHDGFWDSSIAVTTSGEVLLIEKATDPDSLNEFFRVYKLDPDLKNLDIDSCCHTVVEVNSLDGEALLLDLGFTVPADDTLGGLEPNSIYFTRHFRPCRCRCRPLDICVYNLATKTLKRFPHLAAMNLADARWFLPGN